MQHEESLCTLVEAADSWLDAGAFKDYCPNGLQVEGRSVVRRIVGGVTACQALLDAAVERQADLVLVHHGLMWRGDDGTIRGLKKNRLKTLLNHDMSLLAYHLPLDRHPEMGNNIRLGRMLELEDMAPLAEVENGLVWHGRLRYPKPLAEFAEWVGVQLGRRPMAVGDPQRLIHRVAWCTGAAQGYIEQVADTGVDLYLSGEVSEPTWHVAQERGIAYLAAGHHATERYGVQALGQRLAETFNLSFEFIDIPNPV